MTINNSNVVNEFRIRILEESIPRIKKCLSLMDDADIWRSPGPLITSIGCTIQHLSGNTRQWILSGVLGDKDNRMRSEEFIENEHVNLKEILNELELELKERHEEIEGVDLTEVVVIQGFNVSKFSAIIHVIEHFSYHTGQITLLAKLYSEADTGYYSDKDLSVRNE